jgi:hypothetical protein
VEFHCGLLCSSSINSSSHRSCCNPHFACSTGPASWSVSTKLTHCMLMHMHLLSYWMMRWIPRAVHVSLTTDLYKHVIGFRSEPYLCWSAAAAHEVVLLIDLCGDEAHVLLPNCTICAESNAMPVSAVRFCISLTIVAVKGRQPRAASWLKCNTNSSLNTDCASLSYSSVLTLNLQGLVYAIVLCGGTVVCLLCEQHMTDVICFAVFNKS